MQREPSMDMALDLVSSLCVGTTIFIVAFWIALTPVEADVVDDINWYIFTNLQLLDMKDYHLIFKYFSYTTLPLTILIALCKSQLQHSIHLKRFILLTKAVEFVILIINCGLLMFLVLKACKMLYLLNLYLLYLLIKLSSANIVVTPQILVSCVTLLIVFHAANKYLALWSHEQGDDNHWLKNCVGVILFYCLLVLFRYCAVVALQSVAVDCAVLPAKPLLTAHRGCKDNYPENSITAFEETCLNVDWLKSVTTLETDVHISYNGVPFLLHDNTLARTTNIMGKCPKIFPLTQASLLNYSLNGSTCDIEKLRIMEEPISPLQVTKRNGKDTVPTFSEFLTVAAIHNKTVIFDITQPQSLDHPHHKDFIKLVIDAIKTSKIHEEKVWWLYKDERSHAMKAFPKMTQATKTKETPFEEFKQNNISLVNDEWTIPEYLIKKYHNEGLLLNVWVINSRPLFEIFWCHGVKSITTNACDYLNKVKVNTYHEAYRKLYHISDAIGLYLSIMFFVFLILYHKKNSEQRPLTHVLKIRSVYCVPFTIATLLHITFLYINAS